MFLTSLMPLSWLSLTYLLLGSWTDFLPGKSGHFVAPVKVGTELSSCKDEIPAPDQGTQTRILHLLVPVSVFISSSRSCTLSNTQAPKNSTLFPYLCSSLCCCFPNFFNFNTHPRLLTRTELTTFYRNDVLCTV